MASSVRLVLRRLPRLLPWLGEASKLWIFLAVVALSFVASDWLGSCTAVPRLTRLTWAGWLLELFGVLWIAMGIWRKEQQFGKPGFVRVAIDWLARFPLRARHHTLAAGTGGYLLSGGRARLTAWNTPPPDADLAARVASLERNVVFLRDGARNDYEDHEKEIGKLQAELKSERETRARGHDEVAKRLEDALVGDIHLERMSVFWVLLGLTAATVPEFVQYLFGWIYGLLALPFACRP